MFPPKAPYIYSNPAGNDMVVRPVQFENLLVVDYQYYTL